MPSFKLFVKRMRYMRPAQVIGRLRKEKILAKVPSEQVYKKLTPGGLPLFIETLDADSGYISRFRIDDILEDRLTLLNESYNVDWQSWTADEASRIWSFNLHYFEYCVALAVKYRHTPDKKYYDKFRELVLSWIETCSPGNNAAWHPYAISRRIPNWLICSELFGSVFEEDDYFIERFYQSIFDQYRSLSVRLETWQLGDHYIDNLKTLVLCAVLFEDDKAYDRWLKRFIRELGVQVLPDGVHFERSMMIHKTVLESVIRVYNVLDKKKPGDSERLKPVLSRMLNAAASLEKGMGHTPLFNDSADNVAKSINSLISAAFAFGIEPEYTDTFADSGYYKLYQGTTALMFDAGEIGPVYKSDHGHCDCLSFELSIGGVPLFVNSGTYMYKSSVRRYFRSAAAHNTAVPKDGEQSELWGDYGVYRRVSDITCRRDGNKLSAGCVLYDGTDHTRTLTLGLNEFTVMDNISNTQAQQIHSYLHLAPNCDVIKRGGKYMILRGGIDICTLTPKDCDCVLHTSGELTSYAPEMGKLEHTRCLEFAWEKDGLAHGYTCTIRTNAAPVAEI